MKMKKKKMDLERLADSAFSVPGMIEKMIIKKLNYNILIFFILILSFNIVTYLLVSRWDGKEDEIKEEEKKKRDIESRRKRKYEEMDEEIDSGRVRIIFN